MVRTALEARFGRRERFSGRFKHYGTKVGYQGRVERTVLLVHIADSNGLLVCDHLWFNDTKGFQSVQPQEGDTIEFDARVSDYVKGYVRESEDIDEQEIDYKLSYPTKFKKVMPVRESGVELEAFSQQVS